MDGRRQTRSARKVPIIHRHLVCLFCSTQEVTSARQSAGRRASGREVRGAAACRKRPTFTLVAVLSLALGIGATTTVFSLVDSLLLRPLPVPHPERLVTLEQVSTDGVRQYNLSYDDAERFGELTGSVWSALAATSWADAYDGSVDAAGDWRRAETLRVSLVTGDYFQVLGVRPRAGRALIGEDDTGAASPVAFIADRYWARRFGRSADAIGRDIQLNGTRFIVVGIAPA